MLSSLWKLGACLLLGQGALLGLGTGAAAADGNWRFAFDRMASGNGTVMVSPQTYYSTETGYGFERGTDCQTSVTRPASPGEGKTCKGPLVFSLAVPEGDYRVTVTLGAGSRASETTVWAETRRLMLGPVRTKAGRTVTRSFVVNVRNAHLPPPPPTAPGGTDVRLNSREIGIPTWDDKLTLTFSGAAPRVAAVEIRPVDVPRLFLLGDSTVTDQPAEPYAAWGQMLPWFFGPGIAVANYAESGETLKSFMTSLRFAKVLSEVRRGDFALLQFGHNDEKSQWPQTYAPADSLYPAYLRLYILELKRLGAKPMLVTSMQRLQFDATGHIQETHGGYPAAMRAVAAAEGVPLIDLNVLSKTLFETLGPQRGQAAFARANGALDTTHQSSYGAYELSKLIVQALKDQSLPIASYLKADLPAFDPTHPDPVSDRLP